MESEDILFKKMIQLNPKGLERQAFENGLKNNPTKEKDWQDFQSTHSALLANELLKTKNSLAVHHQKTQRFHFFKVIGFAFILTSILGLVWIFSQKKTENPLQTSQTSERKDTAFEESIDRVVNETTLKTEIEERKSVITQKHSSSIEKEVSEEKIETIVEDVKTKTAVEIGNKLENQVSENQDFQEVKGDLPIIKKVCEISPINIELSAKPTCRNESNGSISLVKISGGQKPYKKWITNEDGIQTNNFEQLSAGTYKILVEDAEKCLFEKIVKIEIKNCPLHIAFNPTFEREVVFPVVQQQSQLEIKDRNNRTIMNKTVIANEVAVWDGRTASGEVEEGLFHFVLKSENEMYFGTITVKF